MNELAKKDIDRSRPFLRTSSFPQFFEKLQPGWEIVEEHHLQKEYQFDTYAEALVFSLKTGEVGEKTGHHADFCIYLPSRVVVKIHTHRLNGLTENDFILAAKMDEI